MNSSQLLLDNIDRLHTTEMGRERIKKNLGLPECDVISFCRGLITDATCRISRKGKNWNCENRGVVITVNASSYTVITAHPYNAISEQRIGI